MRDIYNIEHLGIIPDSKGNQTRKSVVFNVAFSQGTSGAVCTGKTSSPKQLPRVILPVKWEGSNWMGFQGGSICVVRLQKFLLNISSAWNCELRWTALLDAHVRSHKKNHFSLPLHHL